MKQILAAFASGMLLAGGLLVSGMTDPRKVVGFLDIFGDWNPALAFVMAAAVSIYFVANRVVMKQSAPVLDKEWHVPTNRRLSPALLVGASLFGVGWGISGYCPGPALVSLAGAQLNVWLFVAAMLGGMAGANALERRVAWRR